MTAVVSPPVVTDPHGSAGSLVAVPLRAASGAASGPFVALPDFSCNGVGGFPLGPLFELLVEHAASKEKELVR